MKIDFEKIKDVNIPIKAHSTTSTCFTDDQKKYVLKVFNGKYQSFDTMEREAHILNFLKDENFVPRIISSGLMPNSNEKAILMTHCGEEINRNNIPNDWENQLKNILERLDSYKIKHNDIYKKADHHKTIEILVKDKKMYLVDFGWATIDGKMNCGNDQISNEPKPSGGTDDKLIIEVIKKRFAMKYMNKSRNNAGSQKEIPSFTLKGNNISVDGYQRFELSNNDITIKSKIDKYNNISQVLQDLKCESICDIGCSNGLVGYIANSIGFKNITLLDHDKDCIKLIKNINKHFNFSNIKAKEYSFYEEIEQHDVVSMFAIIHWIFSCTAGYGNFDDIFETISPVIKKYLIIEWVDPNDSAIRSFQHLRFNENIHKENYNVKNFVKSLEKKIGTVEKIIDSEKTSRKIYVVKRYNV